MSFDHGHGWQFVNIYWKLIKNLTRDVTIGGGDDILSCGCDNLETLFIKTIKTGVKNGKIVQNIKDKIG